MPDNIGFEINIQKPYEQAKEDVIEALKKEGFGVLTQIDVKATLKEKLDLEFRPYAILGACNPPLAHRALSSDGRIGLMLPCNVTVEETSESNSLVRIANPETMMQVGDVGYNPEIRKVALEARKKLERVARMLLDT